MTSKELTERIKRAGFRVTKPRLQVLSLLVKSKYPLRSGEIFKKLKQTSSADKVTVYRILEAYKKAGLVNQIDFRETAAYFEFKDSERDHHHIICVECKKVDDFVGCDADKLSAEALSQAPRFAKIINHSFEFFGLCRMCA